MLQTIALPNSQHWPWIACGIAGSFLTYLYVHRTLANGNKNGRVRGHARPPGPKPLPVIGNVLNFPANRWYEKFCEWQKEYSTWLVYKYALWLSTYLGFPPLGDVVYIELIGKHFLVINSLEDAEELANKRSNIYSGRPYNIIIIDL